MNNYDIVIYEIPSFILWAYGFRELGGEKVRTNE